MEHATSESASTPETPEIQSLKAHACALCQRRKVKCDRKEPCRNCAKAKVECIFRAPVPQRRRPRKPAEATLLARVRRYEELLKGFGVKIEAINGDAEIASRVKGMAIDAENVYAQPHEDLAHVQVERKQAEPTVERGEIVVKNGKTRYLENKLWTHLSDEFMEASDILPVSSEDEDTGTLSNSQEIPMDPHGGDLLLDSSSPSPDLRSQHPEPYQAFRLWQIFLNNVNPLTKVLHAPTMQQSLLEATGKLDDVPRAMEPLIFAIYSCAVFSLSNAECESITGNSKPVMLNKFQSAARLALVRAGLLRTSNMLVLQAFTLFLLSMHLRYDSHTLWTLTGVAVRIAQRSGLHRDGVDLKLPPFETEMRRRLWWQIIALEARAAEFSGVGQTIRNMQFSTRLPLNVNDSSLHPSMPELPVEETGVTEMVYCLMRYEFGHFLKTGGAKSTIDGSWQQFTSSEISVKDKELAIKDWEAFLDQKYLRHCHQSIPLHFISSIMTSSMIAKLRFRAYHPRHYWARVENVLPEEKEMLFSTCVKTIELDNIIQSNVNTKGFLWHVNSQFPFDALIHVLSELRPRTADEKTNRAWQQVDEVFQHHQGILTETRKGLHMAITRLAVRAWDIYESHAARDHLAAYQIQSPLFRKALMSKTALLQSGHSDQTRPNVTDGEQMPAASASTESMIDTLDPYFDFNNSTFESSSMDWSRWDDLLQDFELNAAGPSF
ncbi:MAG: hypothetical protein Q9195_006993 [Heterodermia aff. obscurata]